MLPSFIIKGYEDIWSCYCCNLSKMSRAQAELHSRFRPHLSARLWPPAGRASSLQAGNCKKGAGDPSQRSKRAGGAGVLSWEHAGYGGGGGATGQKQQHGPNLHSLTGRGGGSWQRSPEPLCGAWQAWWQGTRPGGLRSLLVLVLPSSDLRPPSHLMGHTCHQVLELCGQSPRPPSPSPSLSGPISKHPGAHRAEVERGPGESS